MIATAIIVSGTVIALAINSNIQEVLKSNGVYATAVAFFWIVYLLDIMQLAHRLYSKKR